MSFGTKPKTTCTFFRFLSPESTVAYFKLGSNPVGKFVATSAALVDSELPCFKPIVDILHVSKVQTSMRISLVISSQFM